jgi:hypothetical protein
MSEAYSGSSVSVHFMRSLRRRRYLGQRWTIVRSQSRNLSFPQRGSVSCPATNAENAELVFRRVVKAADDELNDVTNGVYKDRYGKCDKRTGDRGGGLEGNCTDASGLAVVWRSSLSEEKNAR